MPTLVLQVGVGHVLWRLMRQIGISTWIATSLAGAFIVNGGTATVLFAPIQFGFIGALLLGLIAIMMANHPTPDGRREAAAAAIAVLSLTFSGVAPAIVAGAVTVAFLRRGWRGATRLGVPAAAVYLLWFAIWGHEDVGNDGFAFGDLAHVPDFVWSGLRTTVDLGTPLRALSAVLVAALGVWLVLHRRWARTDAAPAFAMVIAAVLLYFIISSQRIAVFEATGSVPDRYAYISWALVLPAFGLALHDIGRRTTIRRVIAVVVGAVLLVNALSDLRQEYNKQAARARGVRSNMLGATAFVEREPYLPNVIVDYNSADGVTPVDLLELQKRGDLPALPALTPDVRRKAATAVQVRFNRKRTAPGLDRGSVVSMRSIRDATAEPISKSCLRVEPEGPAPQVAFTVDRRSTLRVRTARRDDLVVRLEGVAGDVDAVSLPQRLRPRQVLYIQLARGTMPVLELPRPSATTVCGVAVAAELSP